MGQRLLHVLPACAFLIIIAHNCNAHPDASAEPLLPGLINTECTCIHVCISCELLLHRTYICFGGSFGTHEILYIVYNIEIFRTSATQKISSRARRTFACTYKSINDGRERTRAAATRTAVAAKTAKQK